MKTGSGKEDMTDKARPLKVLSRRLVPLLFLLALGSCVNDKDEINRVTLKETDPAEIKTLGFKP